LSSGKRDVTYIYILKISPNIPQEWIDLYPDDLSDLDFRSSPKTDWRTWDGIVEQKLVETGDVKNKALSYANSEINQLPLSRYIAAVVDESYYIGTTSYIQKRLTDQLRDGLSVVISPDEIERVVEIRDYSSPKAKERLTERIDEKGKNNSEDIVINMCDALLDFSAAKTGNTKKVIATLLKPETYGSPKVNPDYRLEKEVAKEYCGNPKSDVHISDIDAFGYLSK